MALSGKLTKKLVENLGAGRHGDGNGLYLVVDPSGARRWIVRVVVKGQKNKKGAPLRTDFGLGGADIVSINQARERALEYRRMAKQGMNPRLNARQEIPTFEEVAQQVHIDRHWSRTPRRSVRHNYFLRQYITWIPVLVKIENMEPVHRGQLSTYNCQPTKTSIRCQSKMTSHMQSIIL